MKYVYLYIYILATYVVVLNTITAYRLFKDEDYNITQKLMQFLVIWIVPIFGSFLVAHFINQKVESDKKYFFLIRAVAGLFAIRLTKEIEKEPTVSNGDCGCGDTVDLHNFGFSDSGGFGGGDI